VDQLLQILGAVLVLAAYAAAQVRLIDSRSFVYGFFNLAGSAILALLALGSRQWGFLLLEGTWALISLWAVFAYLRRSRPPSRGAAKR
jgi:drug/metabolite transporter (DMT)-like permease